MHFVILITHPDAKRTAFSSISSIDVAIGVFSSNIHEFTSCSICQDKTASKQLQASFTISPMPVSLI
jgi:hypothetical protein